MLTAHLPISSFVAVSSFHDSLILKAPVFNQRRALTEPAVEGVEADLTVY